MLEGVVRHAIDETRKHAAANHADALALRENGSPEGSKEWQDDLRILLAGVAAAIDLPEALRHVRTLRLALRDAMRGWEALADDPTLPVEKLVPPNTVWPSPMLRPAFH